MSLCRIIAISSCVAGSVLMASAAHADVTYSDTSFAEFELGFQKSSGDSVLTVTSCATCGESSSSGLELSIATSDGSNLGAAVINPLFSYNPQTDGAIASISASVDKDFTVSAPPLYYYGNTFRLIVEQDNQFYTAVVFDPNNPGGIGAPSGTSGVNYTTSSGYLTLTLTDQTATDFNEFDQTTGVIGTGHPDFAGDLLYFGIGQVLSANPAAAGPDVTLTSDFDNLMIDVTSVPVTGAVPEPATWAMFIAGMGLVGWAMRRRQQQRATISFA